MIRFGLDVVVNDALYNCSLCPVEQELAGFYFFGRNLSGEFGMLRKYKIMLQWAVIIDIFRA